MKYLNTYKEHINEMIVGSSVGGAASFGPDKGRIMQEHAEKSIRQTINSNKDEFNKNFTMDYSILGKKYKLTSQFLETIFGLWTCKEMILYIRYQAYNRNEFEITLLFKRFESWFGTSSIPIGKKKDASYSLTFNSVDEILLLLTESGIDIGPCWNENFPIRYCTSYDCQKKLINKDITNISKFKNDGVTLDPRIEKEYPQDINAVDLGLF